MAGQIGVCGPEGKVGGRERRYRRRDGPFKPVLTFACHNRLMRRSSTLTSRSDRRDSARTPTTLRAKAFPGGIDCVVKDFSQRGAKLRFSGPQPRDDRIVVVIWATGAAAEAVRCWSGDVETGWRFLSRFDLRGPVPKGLAAVKAEWLGRRRKLHRRALQDCGVMIGYRGSPRGVHLS